MSDDELRELVRGYEKRALNRPAGTDAFYVAEVADDDLEEVRRWLSENGGAEDPGVYNSRPMLMAGRKPPQTPSKPLLHRSA